MSLQRIPFTNLQPGEDASEVRAAIDRVLERGWFVLGPEVAAFESEFAAVCGAAHAVGVGSGTDALALTLRAAGIGAGDEVVTSTLANAFGPLAIAMAGARPVFADVDPLRLTLDPAAAEAAITPRTAALMPVHLYGQAADMSAFVQIAQRHGLALVEDCTHAPLATCAGRPVGTFGLAGGFSFYPTKNLGALGDGGAVVTLDGALAERLRRLRNGGQTTRYHHVETGVTSRLDELQAAVLRARLPFLRKWTARRRELACHYRAGLPDASAADGLVSVPPEFDPGHVYHLFPVRSPERTALQAHLAAQGIDTLIHYPLPISRQPAFAAAAADSAVADCPVAARVCTEILSLPLYPSLRDAHVQTVAMAVSGFAASRSVAAKG